MGESAVRKPLAANENCIGDDSQNIAQQQCQRPGGSVLEMELREGVLVCQPLDPDRFGIERPHVPESGEP